MYDSTELKMFRLDNTEFIFKTNFSGDPSRDNFGNDARKGNIVINDIPLARALKDMGINVKETVPGPKTNPEEFVPKFYASVRLNYDSPIPPKVVLVDDEGFATKLTEKTVGQIDKIRVKRVRAVINIYKAPSGKHSLYVRTMYVEQDIGDDPFASDYARREDDDDDMYE